MTQPKIPFETWRMALNNLCQEMFLNSWEDLGGDDAEAKDYFDSGLSPQETCNRVMEKYELDDCRKPYI